MTPQPQPRPQAVGDELTDVDDAGRQAVGPPALHGVERVAPVGDDALQLRRAVAGVRRVVQAVRASDLGLAEISASFDFLLAVTPVNTEEAWLEFTAAGRAITPTLRYRMLAVDPELGKRRLYQLPFERLEERAQALAGDAIETTLAREGMVLGLP